jgi:phosphomethylpyrimidine synthase
MTFKVTREGELAWRTRQDVRKYAAEQGIAEHEALEKGLKEKSAEFAKKGSEVYPKV